MKERPMTSRTTTQKPTSRVAYLLVALTVATTLAACSSGGSSGQSIPKGCTVVDMASSPEKFELLTDLARRFNGSKEAKADGKCAFVRVLRKSSGLAMQLLADGWPDEAANGPRPVVWSPASSAWGAVLDQRLADKGQPPTAPEGAQAFMLTPLVIAMPRPMAEALGWPGTPIGYADILALAQDPAGWGGQGPPRVGAVPPRQDQPELLHQRPVRHHRPVLRGHRQDPGPDQRGPGPAPRSTSSPGASRRRSSTTATSP